MSISSIGLNTAGTSVLGPTSLKQRQADFKSLSTALQNNDLAAAQQAFAQIQKDDPKLAQAIQNQESNSSSGKSPIGDFANLAAALNKGDLSGAQSAFQSLQTHRHHGGHHHAAQQVSSGTDSDGDNDGSSAASSSTVGTVIDTSA